MDSYAVENWKRLGEMVTKERLAQGFMTAKELAEGMGVTSRVIGDLENGRRSNYGNATLRKLEIALGWENQSVAAVLSGGQPERIREAGVISESATQIESERIAETRLALSKESSEQLMQGIRDRAEELHRRVQNADRLLAQFQAEQQLDPALLQGSQDEYDLVADDGYGYSHEEEDEQREMEP